MNVDVVGAPNEVSQDAVIIVPFFEGDDASDSIGIPDYDAQIVAGLIERGDISARYYHVATVYRAERGPLLFVGAGKRDALDHFTLKRVAAAAARFAAGRGYRSVGFVLRGLVDESAARAVVEGALYGPHDPGLMKTRNPPDRGLDSVTVVGRRDVASGARVGQIVGEAQNVARDLVNLPPNELTPRAFAERAHAYAGEYGLTCEALDESRMRELGMGGILGVAQGSAQPPRFIVMRYGDESAPNRLALCGKGLTFDSGGLSLKTGEGMMTMKSDMGGGAAAVGGMLAIARLAPEGVHVTAYIGATENMPGGNAIRPGDVLRAMNGETIEVLNTDAEGRIVLADVLSYAVAHGATHIVDFATLTGAANVALGGAAALATGNNEAWIEDVVEAARNGLERAWPMPLYREYREAMNSEVADIKNVSGSRGGGALTAAAFLSDFAADVPWTHLDIAGVAFRQTSEAYSSTGGTGVGVGTAAGVAVSLAARTG